jgi:hypothetical protein
MQEQNDTPGIHAPDVLDGPVRLTLSTLSRAGGGLSFVNTTGQGPAWH